MSPLNNSAKYDFGSNGGNMSPSESKLLIKPEIKINSTQLIKIDAPSGFHNQNRLKSVLLNPDLRPGADRK